MAMIAPPEIDREIAWMLDLIAFAEATSTSRATQNDGYDVIVTGISGPDGSTDRPGPETFTDYSTHPFLHRRPKLFRLPDVPANRSSAAGRYQLLGHYFPIYQAQLGLPDFSPLSQDRIAIAQMRERHALPVLSAGRIEEAIALCSGTWASLPGNHYGQGGRTMAELMEWWGSHAGNVT